MAKVNPNAIQQMAAILNELTTMKRESVIDVCCGGCELTRDLLRHQFEEIDFMDESLEAIDVAKRLKLEFSLKSEFFHLRMQHWGIKKKYNCIVMRYCIGYVNNQEAV